MHLHGFYFEVDSRGTWAADTAYSPADRRDGRDRADAARRYHGRCAGCPRSRATGSSIAISPSTSRPSCTCRSRADRRRARRPRRSTRMSGLVLGITVKPGTRVRVTAAAGRTWPARLRLVAQPAPQAATRPTAGVTSLQEGPASAGRRFDDHPGPMLVLERGKPVRITVVNRLRASRRRCTGTGSSWRATRTACRTGAARGRVLRPIEPGDSFAAEFTPPRAGTFMYHAHFERDAPDARGPLRPADRDRAGYHPRYGNQAAGAHRRSCSRNDTAFGVINGRRARRRSSSGRAGTYRLPAVQHRRRAHVVRAPPGPTRRPSPGALWRRTVPISRRRRRSTGGSG